MVVQVPETLIPLQPNQIIYVNNNDVDKVMTVYDELADNDLNMEQVSESPIQQQQQQRSVLKLRDSPSQNDTTYRNIGDFTIRVQIPMYDGYDQSNPYSITQNGSGVISIPQNYEGLGEINYNVNVPQPLVNNYTQSTITTNGIVYNS